LDVPKGVKTVTACFRSRTAGILFMIRAEEHVVMNAHLRRITGEELVRSIVWFALGLVGWPFLASAVAWVEPSLMTVFGFPVLTWALLTVCAIGVRALTEMELRVQTPAGLSINVALGIMLAGVGAVYLAAVEGHSALLVTVTYVAVTLSAVLWHWYVAPGTPQTRVS
jgi:hypothetical protein